MLKDIRRNPIILTDDYNLSHQFLKINTDWEVSHLYNRNRPMILFGLHENINSILTTKITMEMIDEAEQAAIEKGDLFPRELWEGVVKECNGYIPIEVQMLPEGTWCPTGTPFAQVSNTVKGYGEMVTWFEGIFMHSHFPSTAATQAFRMRKYLEQKKRQYGYDDSFMLRFHSFGFRGHRSLEDAYWAGIAWNLFLQGTDDFHTKIHTPKAEVVSIAALAHKVTQQFDDEFECYKHAIKAVHDQGKNIVALVIDTYDAYRFIDEYLIPLARYAEDLGIHIVIRPDSGDTWEQALLVYKKVSRFYLPIKNVSVIIGENMDFENAKKADEYFEQHGVPLNFINYGIGGGFYNYITREILGWAMKTAYSNGKDRMKFSENPIKRSIPGVVGIYRNEYGDMVVDKVENVADEENMYITVYNGDDYASIFNLYTHDEWLETRERALSQNTEQAVIYLSENIRKEIGEFQKRYRNL